MTFQILDDLSDVEKNLQMHNVNDPRDLVDRADMVREWDTEKSERLEKSFSKLNPLILIPKHVFIKTVNEII